MAEAVALTRRRFAALGKALEGERVLSVYLAREGSDPGKGDVWRKRLDGEIARIRDHLEKADPSQLPDFEAALRLITEATSAFGRVLPSKGWAAFATTDQLWHTEVLPYAPVPTARWRQGVFAAPHVRSFKGDRPVVVAVVDEWSAVIYELRSGRLTDELELGAERSLADMSDVGTSKRTSTLTGATGVRGATRTDAARRTLDEEVRRLRGQIGTELVSRAGDSGFVVVGGIEKATRAVLQEIDDKLEGRVEEVPELSFDTSREELMAKVEGAASILTRSRQSKLLDTCAESIDRGSMGWNDTHRALEAGAVDVLLLSRAMIESSPDDAERLVSSALAQGADVEELGGELGARLMEEADGVAARLRFRPVSIARRSPGD